MFRPCWMFYGHNEQFIGREVMNHEGKLPVRVTRSNPISKGRKSGGKPPKCFFETEEEFLQRQKSLIQEVDHVQKYFQESFQKSS